MPQAYRKVFPRGCSGQVQVWGADNRIDVPLTHFARQLPTTHAETTSRGYLNEVLRIHNWIAADPMCARQGWSLGGSPEAARNAIEHFLYVEYGCEIRTHTDDMEQQYRRVKASDKTPVSAPQLIAGLNNFYHTLRRCGLYPHDNPMIVDGGDEKIRAFKRRAAAEFKAQYGRARMNSASGVDPPLSLKRLTSSYFRLYAGDWIPQVINDPDLPNHVYRAGELAGWDLREKCIVRILFEAGPRISEVLAIDISDWFRLGAKRYIDVPDKGSNGNRVKQLVISPPTARMLRTYVNTERMKCDSNLRRFLDFEKMDPALLKGHPLFLSAGGERLAVDTFRRCYWVPALRAYGLAMRIHQARHWFVTQEVQDIQTTTNSPEERRHREDTLLAYMAWKSGRQMLAVYNHALTKGNSVGMLENSHARMQMREKAFAREPLPMSMPTPKTSLAELQQDLNPALLEIWQEGDE